MILTCPSCSASYNVPNEAIGVDGRAVRCKKCHHEWFQQGEKKALEDLINMVQSSDISLDELAFDDSKKKPKIAIEKKSEPKVKLSTRLATVTDKIIPKKLKNYLFSDGNRGFLSYFASFMVALAVFMCLIWVLVACRWGITSVIPSLTSTYESAGFPLTNYARINPEEALIIDRVVLDTEGGKRQIIGSLINLTSLNIQVPMFKLAYLDDKGAVLQEGKQTLPVKIIQKEAAIGFSLDVPKSVPESFSSVHISFTDATPAKHDELPVKEDPHPTTHETTNEHESPAEHAEPAEHGEHAK